MERAARKSCRTQLTKLLNQANEQLVNNSEDINELVVISERVRKANESLESANEQVKSVLPTEGLNDEQLQAEFAKVLDYQDEAIQVLSRLQLRIDAHQTNETNQANGIQVSRSVSRISQGNNNVKLPKLELRKFKGDLSEWTLFWEQFRTAIHENETLDPIAKFNYLEGVLTGKAAATIAGFTPTAKAYEDAINLLKHEYGNKQRIIDTHIQKLLALTPVKSKLDCVGLRALYNAILSISRNLTALGVKSNEYGMMIKSVILNCMPHLMKIEYHKRHYDEEKNDNIGDQIEILLNYLKLEVESIEMSQTSLTSDTSPVNAPRRDERRPQAYKSRQSGYTAMGLLTTNMNSCLFCKSHNHMAEKCTEANVTMEQRKEILKGNNCCFRCTKPNHRSKFCRNKVTCGICSSRHVSSMCDPDYRKEKHAQTTILITKNPENENVQQIFLQTAKAFLSSTENENKNAFVRLILDGGSQLTYIRQDISRKLRLKIVGTRKLSVMPFGVKEKTTPKIYNKVELKLISQFNDEVITIHALEVPEICFDSFHMPNIDHPAITSMNLADISIGHQCTVDGIVLLIGADNYWKIATGEFVRLTDKLTALNTKLGWTLQGPSGINENNEITNLNAVIAATLHVQAYDETNDLDMKQFWDLETIGIRDKETQTAFTEDYIVNNIALVNGRFEVSLPFKNECPLDNNYIGAVSRLKRLTFKLSKDSRLMEYDGAVRELFEFGFAEKVPLEDLPQKTYYMPHRPVYREDKATTKIRVVFDASAHAPGLPSLNELLSTGENLVQDLVKIFLNFRIGKLAITADIEKAFLQIGLSERDRDLHRFLWFSDPINDVNNLPELQIYRMKRVTFGVASSPFMLAATLKKLFITESPHFPETADRLSKSFYVDDLVATVNSVEEATKLYEESKLILGKAGMNLRKWSTNHRDFQGYLKDNQDGANAETCPKVLGIFWDTSSDSLCLDLSSVMTFVNEQRGCTKRSVLQSIGRVYDPLCWLGPFTIRAKILLQSIWRLNLDWDAELPPDLSSEWNKWCKELASILSFTIPRNIAMSDECNYELHVFADASRLAYGSVAYVRELSENTVNVQFLIAKNRVAPIKTIDSIDLSLPRLELTAALCASRLKDYIVKNVNLKFEKVYLWTDSQITLYWITGDAAKWKTFVYNRVVEIQKLTKDSVWRHCPGKVNPADYLTRGVRAGELVRSETWLNGPDFLSRADCDWPAKNEQCDFSTETQVFAIGSNEIETCGLKPIFPIEKYERFEKCLRVTAYVKRVFQKRKSSSVSLTTEEINDAENYWIQLIQREAFSQEIESLKENDCVDKKSSIYKLTPFLDPSGILRIASRLQESDLTYEAANPIILPKKSPFVEKLIWQTHNRCFHGGINLTLNEIRKRYWVIRARQTIKSQIVKCVICKKLRGKPGQEIYAPLPKNRISKSSPFEHTGVDFAGPLYVTENDQRRKSYLMLLTCAATRAVHLELVLDLTAESCIRGFRRFVARRGIPSTLYSDNAKTFKRVSVELNRLYESLSTEEVASFCLNRRIKWNFIIERAAWWGGFWERLIRTVKDGLKFALGKSMVNVDELQTILTEIEATVNSRPLTYIDDDKNNLSVLSPSNFLLGNQRRSLLPAASSAANRDSIVANWKERQRILCKFWKKWSTEYLQQLRTAHVNVWAPPKNSFSVGDIVLLHDEKANRLAWKMVRVTEVYPGRDGRVRACEVQLPNKTKIRRPVQLLYHLEIPIAAREGEENVEE